MGLDLLVDRLTGAWGVDHEAIVYEAPMTPTDAPIIEPIALRDLETALLTARSMLYIPPLADSSTNVIAPAQLAARLAIDRP